MVQQLLTGPAPQVQPTLAGSGQSSALEMTVLNQRNASALNELAGGFKGRRSRKSRRRSKRRTARGSKKYKKGRKLTRRTRNKRSRLYKGGAGEPIPYSAPTGSNAAVLNISEELALAHATANLNAKLDGAATNAPNK
jgi:hypothetical protein